MRADTPQGPEGRIERVCLAVVQSMQENATLSGTIHRGYGYGSKWQ